MKFAIVVSRFNETVTQGLLGGAKSYLREKEIRFADEDIFYAPGAFEIPLIAQRLAKTKRYDGVICLGCVIKGDTMHFEFISLGATLGIIQGMLNTNIPIAFGVLTTQTEEQAFERSQDNHENKGREAAAACVEAACVLRKIETLSPESRN